jgi:general secretion pathway protein G
LLINLRKKIANQKGFTLVELMVVVAIIGILAAIVIPKFSASTATAQDAKLKADLRTVDGTIMQYYAANSKYPADAAALYSTTNTTYLASWPKDAKDGAIVYALDADTISYTLKGKDSKNKDRLSPGSKGYTDAKWE